MCMKANVKGNKILERTFMTGANGEAETVLILDNAKVRKEDFSSS